MPCQVRLCQNAVVCPPRYAGRRSCFGLFSYPRNSSNGYCFCSSHLGSPILLINNIFQMVAVESRERPLNRGESTGLTRRLSFPKMKRNVFLGGSHLKTPSETCIDSKKIRLCCDEVQDVCESLELKSFNHYPVCRSM